MSVRVHVELKGLDSAIERLAAAGDRDAGFAMKTAVRAGARKARSLAAKGIAVRLGVPMKVLKRRVQAFVVKGRGGGIGKGFSTSSAHASVRLWMGLKSPPDGREHKRVQNWLLAHHARAKVARNGSVYTTLSNGKFDRWMRIPLGAEHEPVLVQAAHRALFESWIPTLRKDYLRRVKKRRS